MKKNKNYYRDAITEINKKSKNGCALKELHKIADLFYRAYDAELYKTMTEEEYVLFYCIKAVLLMENPEDVCRTETFIRAIARNPSK